MRGQIVCAVDNVTLGTWAEAMPDTTDELFNSFVTSLDRERPTAVAASRPANIADAACDLLRFVHGRRFATILADPPWQFTNKTGKVAPEHKRLSRYGTMKLDEIKVLP